MAKKAIIMYNIYRYDFGIVSIGFNFKAGNHSGG
jgi:hypothetical protein